MCVLASTLRPLQCSGYVPIVHSSIVRWLCSRNHNGCCLLLSICLDGLVTRTKNEHLLHNQSPATWALENLDGDFKRVVNSVRVIDNIGIIVSREKVMTIQIWCTRRTRLTARDIKEKKSGIITMPP